MLRSKSELYGYQRRAIEFVKSKPNCALWVEMGLGKSVSAATAFADLQENFDSQRMLVIGPLRVARKVWSDEFKSWDHLNHLTTSKMHGSEKNRLAALNTDADVHTINQENVSWLSEQFVQGKKLIRKWPWDLVVIDESQGFRNQSSGRFKSLKRLRRLFPRCVELTGTPSPNGYGNLWSQIHLLDGGSRLGGTEKDFRDRWFESERNDGYVSYTLKETAAKQIQAAVSDIVLSLRVEDYFDLPPVTFNHVRVALSPAALQTYKKFERTYIAEIRGKTITAVSAGVLNGKLMQLANGSIYTDTKRNFEIFHEEKTEALAELCDGVSGPAIVAFGFQADAHRIRAVLDRACGRSKTWAMADTDFDLQRFADGKLDFIVMHPASAGHGLNDLHLSGSETIIWFGLTNNLEYWQQLNARLTGGLRRMGKNVVIHMIVADETVDERNVDLLNAKAASQDDLTRSMVQLAKAV